MKRLFRHTRYVAAALVGLLLATTPPQSAAADKVEQPAVPAWTMTNRCVADVCVGDTIFMLRRLSSPRLKVRKHPTNQMWEVIGDQHVWLQAEIEMHDDIDDPSTRIFSITVLRPGTRTGLGDAVLGGPAAPLLKAASGSWSEAKTWLENPEEGARMWFVKRSMPPATGEYSTGYRLDKKNSLVSAELVFDTQSEVGYADLASALIDTQTRLQSLYPELAKLPPPAIEIKSGGALSGE